MPVSSSGDNSNNNNNNNANHIKALANLLADDFIDEDDDIFSTVKVKDKRSLFEKKKGDDEKNGVVEHPQQYPLPIKKFGMKTKTKGVSNTFVAAAAQAFAPAPAAHAVVVEQGKTERKTMTKKVVSKNDATTAALGGHAPAQEKGGHIAVTAVNHPPPVKTKSFSLSSGNQSHVGTIVTTTPNIAAAITTAATPTAAGAVATPTSYIGEVQAVKDTPKSSSRIMTSGEQQRRKGSLQDYFIQDDKKKMIGSAKNKTVLTDHGSSQQQQGATAATAAAAAAPPEEQNTDTASKNSASETVTSSLIFGIPDTFGAAGMGTEGNNSDNALSSYMPNVRERADAINLWKATKAQEEKKNGWGRALEWTRVVETAEGGGGQGVGGEHNESSSASSSFDFYEGGGFSTVGGGGGEGARQYSCSVSTSNNKKKSKKKNGPPSFLAKFEQQLEEEEEKKEKLAVEEPKEVENHVDEDANEVSSLNNKNDRTKKNTYPSFLAHFEQQPQEEEETVVENEGPEEELPHNVSTNDANEEHLDYKKKETHVGNKSLAAAEDGENLVNGVPTTPTSRKKMMSPRRNNNLPRRQALSPRNAGAFDGFGHNNNNAAAASPKNKTNDVVVNNNDNYSNNKGKRMPNKVEISNTSTFLQTRSSLKEKQTSQQQQKFDPSSVNNKQRHHQQQNNNCYTVYPSLMVSPRHKPPMSPRFPLPSSGTNNNIKTPRSTGRGNNKTVHRTSPNNSRPFFSEDNANQATGGDGDGGDDTMMASNKRSDVNDHYLMTSPMDNKPPTTPRKKTPFADKMATTLFVNGSGEVLDTFNEPVLEENDKHDDNKPVLMQARELVKNDNPITAKIHAEGDDSTAAEDSDAVIPLSPLCRESPPSSSVLKKVHKIEEDLAGVDEDEKLTASIQAVLARQGVTLEQQVEDSDGNNRSDSSMMMEHQESGRMTPVSMVMKEAMNFLRTPRGRHIRVDSVTYDYNTDGPSFVHNNHRGNNNGDSNDDDHPHQRSTAVLTNEECDDELKIAEQLAMALDRFLIEDDSDSASGSCQSLDYNKKTISGEEDEARKLAMALDKFLINDDNNGDNNDGDDVKQDTTKLAIALDRFLMVDRSESEESHIDNGGWDCWIETPKHNNADLNEDDGFSFPMTFHHYEATDGTASAHQQHGNNNFFPSSSFGTEQQQQSQYQANQYSPPPMKNENKKKKKKSLTVATSFTASATVEYVKKQPKIRISIGGAPEFKPSNSSPSNNSGVGEEMFFISQPSPRCGDDTRLFDGGQKSSSSSMPPTPTMETTSTLATAAKGSISNGNHRTKNINIKGFLNSATVLPKAVVVGPNKREGRDYNHHHHRSNHSPSAAGLLLAAPSNESEEKIDDNNIVYANSNTNALRHHHQEGEVGHYFFTSPATPTNDPYPQLRINQINNQQVGQEKIVRPPPSPLFYVGGSTATDQVTNHGNKSNNNNHISRVGSSAGLASANKKAKNLLRRIKKTHLVVGGRNKKKNAMFGSLNDDEPMGLFGEE